jgi:hypothetical protein
MAVTNELIALLRACKSLDNPRITPETVASVHQLSQMLALSFDMGLPIDGDVAEWPDPARRVSFVLALKTTIYTDSLDWPEGNTPNNREWWGNYKRRMRDEWVEARRDAEALVSDAEKAAEGQTAVVAIDNTIPPLVTDRDLPGWSF